MQNKSKNYYTQEIYSRDELLYKHLYQIPPKNGRYIVLDTETTGLKKEDHIIEIGACEIINGNLMTDNDLEEINEISLFESENIGIDNYECYELSFDSFYDKKVHEEIIINEIINKKKKDMINFKKILNKMAIPKQPNEENKYRILSFPWCISGEILTNIKFLNSKLEN